MDALYNHTFHHLDDAFKKLAAQVPPPQKVPHGDSFVFRYVEKTIQQAIVQKLARRYIARTRGLFMVLPHTSWICFGETRRVSGSMACVESHDKNNIGTIFTIPSSAPSSPSRLRQRLSAMMNFVEVFLITT